MSNPSALEIGEESKTSYYVEPAYGTVHPDSKDQVYILRPTASNRNRVLASAASTDHRHLNWNLNLNPRHLIDSYAYINFPEMRFRFNGDFTALNAQAGDNIAKVAYFKNVAFKPGGLLNITDGADVSVNGTSLRSHSKEMRAYTHALLSHADVNDTLSSGLYASAMDRVHNYGEYAPSTSMGKKLRLKSGVEGYLPRLGGQFSPFIETNSAASLSAEARRFNIKDDILITNTYIEFTITDLQVPLMLSVFSMSNLKKRIAIPGIETLQVQLSLNQDIGNLFSLKPEDTPDDDPNVDADLVNSITSIGEPSIPNNAKPQLVYTEIATPSFDQEYYNNKGFAKPFRMNYPEMRTLYQDTVTLTGTSKTVNFETSNMTNVPKYLYIVVNKIKGRDANIDKNVQRSITSRVGLRCSDMSVHFGVLNKYDENELIDCTLRNGIRAWSRDEMKYVVGNTSCIKLSLMTDLAYGNDNLFLNQKVSDHFRIGMTLEELDVDTTLGSEYELFVIGEYDKMYDYEEGKVTIKEFISSGLGTPAFSAKNLYGLNQIMRNTSPIVFGGASFWSKLKGVGSAVLKNLPTIAKYIGEGVNLIKAARGGRNDTSSTVIGGKTKKRIGGAQLDTLHGF